MATDHRVHAKMESDEIVDCCNDPNFAVICDFLKKFGDHCGFVKPNIPDLQKMIESKSEVPDELVKLHVTLLKKMRYRSFVTEKWERYLVKECSICSLDDSSELEKVGYKNASVPLRLRILKYLLQGQFDFNIKLQKYVSSLAADELKTKPVGCDKNGFIYWYNQDDSRNIRIYCEDSVSETWKLVARDINHYRQLIDGLKRREDYTKSGDENVTDDNSLSPNKKIRSDNDDVSDNDKEKVQLIENCVLAPKDNDLDTQNGSTTDNDAIDCNGFKNSDDKELKEPIGDSVLCKDDKDSFGDKTVAADKEVKETTDEGEPKPDNANVPEAVKSELNENGISEAIEEPLMLITGLGAGHDCDMVNLGVTTDVKDDGAITNNDSQTIVKVEKDITEPNNDIVVESTTIKQEFKEEAAENDNVDDLDTEGNNQVDGSLNEKEAKKKEWSVSDFKLEFVDDDSDDDGEDKDDVIVIESTDTAATPSNSQKSNDKNTDECQVLEVIKKRGRPKKGAFKLKKATKKQEMAPKGRKKSTGPKFKRGTLVEIEVTDDEEEKQELLKKLTPNQEIMKKIRLMGINVNDVEVLKSVSSILDDSVIDRPVRLSSRLAQIKIKETAVAHKPSSTDKSSDQPVQEKKNSKKSKVLEKVKKGEQKDSNNKQKAIKKSTFVLTSSATDSDDNDDDDEDYEPISIEIDDDEPLIFKSDHEFSPESDLENDTSQPLRQARTAEEKTGYEDTACEKCKLKTNSDTILLCDKCDQGWHCDCLKPVLYVVPEGDWFCPTCQHTMLIENLEKDLDLYEKLIKKHENEERRKERLAYVGISLSNVLPPPVKKSKEIKTHRRHKRYSSRDSSADSLIDDDRDSFTGSDDDSNSSDDSDGSSHSRDTKSGSEGDIDKTFQVKDKNNGSDKSSRRERNCKKSNKHTKRRKKQRREYDYSDEEPVHRLRQCRRTKANYVFNEYDNMIKSAIQDEMKAVVKEEPNPEPNNNNQEEGGCSEVVNGNDNDTNEPIIPVATIQKKKKRRFGDLDSNDEDFDNNDCDDEFEISSESPHSDDGSVATNTTDDEEDLTPESDDSDNYGSRKKNRRDNKKKKPYDDNHYGFDGLRRSSRVRKAVLAVQEDSSSECEDNNLKSKRKQRPSSDDSTHSSDPDARLYNPAKIKQKLKKIKFPKLEVPTSVANDDHDETRPKNRKRVLTRLSSSSENECNSQSEADNDHSDNSDTVTKDTLSEPSKSDLKKESSPPNDVPNSDNGVNSSSKNDTDQQETVENNSNENFIKKEEAHDIVF